MFLCRTAAGAALAVAAGCEPTRQGASPASSAAAEVGASGGDAAAMKPNIIFILADDLGYANVGCYGQKRIRTPHIDRLAAEGLRFTQVYAGSTVCAPSRCCLMTGMHSGHAFVRGNARVPLRPSDTTVAEALKAAGYATGIVGKWGLGEPDTTGLPTRKGFDYWYGYLNQRHAHNSWPTYLWRNEEKVALPNEVPGADDEGAGVATKRVVHSHDLFAKEALDFVRRQKDGPFFLYLALTIPHANNEAGKSGMEVPDQGPYAGEDWPENERNFAAMVTRMDKDIGALMALLKELGLDERTIVFFTSDNGPHREGGHDPDFFDDNGPLRGIKRDLYEGGIRVPMIARWPGRVPAGKTSGQVWAFWDFLPTAAALAGGKAPAGIDGVSVAPAILGGKAAAHPPLYWEFHERGFSQAVRDGNWKAVRKGGPGKPVELYDLAADLGEEKDVAAAHPDVAARLSAFMDAARTESAEFPVLLTPAAKKK
jgi:arylsulfatase A-like enzyme